MIDERLEPSHDSREALVAYLHRRGLSYCEIEIFFSNCVDFAALLDDWARGPRHIEKQVARFRPRK